MESPSGGPIAMDGEDQAEGIAFTLARYELAGKAPPICSAQTWRPIRQDAPDSQAARLYLGRTRPSMSGITKFGSMRVNVTLRQWAARGTIAPILCRASPLPLKPPHPPKRHRRERAARRSSSMAEESGSRVKWAWLDLRLYLTVDGRLAQNVPANLHVRPAVDIDLLAGDVVAVGREEGDRLGNLLGYAEAADGDARLDLVWTSSGTWDSMSVSVKPGAITLTVIPDLASSSAAVLVKAMIPPLLAP